MKLLHLVPNSFVETQYAFHGSTKDIYSRIEYFEARGIDYDTLVTDRTDKSAIAQLSAVDVSQYETVLIELPLYPQTLSYLRYRAPELTLLTRAINAELYHQWHWLLAENKLNFNPVLHPRRIWNVSRAMRQRWCMDIACGWCSNYLLSITEWETRHYWRYFLPARKAVTVPYFHAKRYLISAHHEARQMRVICMTSARLNPLLKDAVTAFSDMVATLKAELPQWQFSICGDITQVTLPTHPRIEVAGWVEDPFALLAQSRALAILSDYGFGFKTKILDAIMAGCYVLVTPKLYRRLPPEIQLFAIETQFDTVAGIRTALEKTLQPFPAFNVNEALRLQAFNALDKILGIELRKN